MATQPERSERRNNFGEVRKILGGISPELGDQHILSKLQVLSWMPGGRKDLG